MIKENVKQIRPGFYRKEKIYQEKEIKNEKAIRQEDLSILVIEVQNKLFDADEISQNRISRTIQALEFQGLNETKWRLADNTDAIITIDEFKEVLYKALEAQSNLWFKD